MFKIMVVVTTFYCSEINKDMSETGVPKSVYRMFNDGGFTATCSTT